MLGTPIKSLQPALLVFTLLIFAISIYAVILQGFNWPAVFFGDLLQLDWRAQFNADLLMHLLLLAVWAWWRGVVIGFLCVSWGGMFTFPYLLVLIVRNRGDAKGFFYGAQAPRVA